MKQTYGDNPDLSSRPETQNSPENDAEHGAASGLFDQLRKQQSSARDAPTISAENAADLVTSETQQADPDTNALENEGMVPQARRALISLLRQGVILANQKLKLFELICRYQSDIRQHLANVYLNLVLDEKAGVAFVATRDEPEDLETKALEEDEPVSLIIRRTLSLYDTLLLLVLRAHYQARETSGEQRIVIDVERIDSHLTPFLPLTNSTKTDRKKLNAALQKMVSKRILHSVRGSDDRFEITPIIRYVVSADFLDNMLNEYLQLAKENGIHLAVDDEVSDPVSDEASPLLRESNQQEGSRDNPGVRNE
ncbi:MAG: DUF4194 domain-containing protein [Gammaproteobacteria bacterium]